MLLNKNVSLRPAAQSDWPAIEALLLANKLPLDGAQAHLDTYLLAVSNGEIVGSAGAEVYGHIALLRSVAVAPGLHKQGIGKLLLDRLIHEAQRRAIVRLYLLTVTAPEYFAQFGFKRAKIEETPSALKASAEFQGACPACAAFMTLTLQEAPRGNQALPVAVLGAGPVGLKFPRFRGHFFTREGVRDAQAQAALSGGVSSADGRTGARRSRHQRSGP